MRLEIAASVKGIIGSVSGYISYWLASMGDVIPYIKFIGIIASAMVAIATFISLACDIVRKVRNLRRGNSYEFDDIHPKRDRGKP